jgi:hypothetical protein
LGEQGDFYGHPVYVGPSKHFGPSPAFLDGYFLGMLESEINYNKARHDSAQCLTSCVCAAAILSDKESSFLLEFHHFGLS